MNKSLDKLSKKCHKDGHQSQQILMVCLKPECKNNIFCCLTCIDQDHSKHQIISFRKLDKIMNQKLQKYNKNLQKGKISKIFHDYEVKYINSVKSLQNQLLSSVQSLEDEITEIFNEVHKVLNIPYHGQLVSDLIQSQSIQSWIEAIQCIKLSQKYNIGSAADTTLILAQQLKRFNSKIKKFKTQFKKKVGELSSQIKNFNFCSYKYQDKPIFHPIYKYPDILILDNQLTIQKKKNNGNRTIALVNRPLDPINNTIKFKIIKNGEGIPNICLGIAILSIVRSNNFMNCTGSKRGVYCIDQSSTSQWGQIQPSNQATSFSHDSTSNNPITIGFQINEGDIITISIDFPSNTLIFEVGQQLYDMDINYTHKDLYPFVALSNSNSIVQIIE